ncbi:hypothetical protein [Sphingosinithalassobacter portus]|uniref:hypothetical protein n=1 Tax=Stakelama portus TaxID=2676234 RepID=UPI000D6E913F|nr:hypothetical protein [Sphingosinithalassobacter portus]
MKKLLFAVAGFGMIATAIPATASAAPAPERWASINQRQANLEHRINAGVRNGSLTRAEAARLRTAFRSLERLEYRYRQSGHRLTLAERRDLDRRFDQLSRQIRAERHDRDHRGNGRYNRR